ncbi:hypothetical protein QN362_18630 [Actimicrobium sp. CCC2.4]|uniref:hypothetical protein n=1 Tax=Actimicrobium sp. CCC2.4 TaxID=3048606 RepID=UPI002AC9A699|nr:hypothetical protein [Actimicrobium sp. CCC2.4]MEB0137351.1 hypothetical protein [Actimicrobium sp. CCC2.4]WPX33388.1 hypothetical protein RHM62_06015 [Actimicrobium sp. CCC2.4]
MMPLAVPRAGRNCPTSYAYGAGVFAREPDLAAQTLYVIGGLYGNPQALDAIEALAASEADVPQLVFNGDFHWFDTDPAIFADLHARVLRHTALRGNVETELAADDDEAGCGCGYPEDVSDDVVAHSNRIIVALRASAQQALGDARHTLAALPMHLLATVGTARIGIVHGDATTLAGWDFARERLDDPARRAINEQFFRKAGVSLFASSHTCLPALRRFRVEGQECGVINNGAAGLPNFSGLTAGLISRIALTPAPAALNVQYERIFRIDGQDIHVAAIVLDYDQASWRAQFLRDWPDGSVANTAYLQRIDHGPAYSPEQACPAGFK